MPGARWRMYVYSTFLCVYPQTHAEGMTKSCMTKRNRKSRLMSVMILVSYPQAVPLAQRRRRRCRRPPRYEPTLTLAHVCSRVLQWLLRRCVASLPGCQPRASRRRPRTSRRQPTASRRRPRASRRQPRRRPRASRRLGLRTHEPSYTTLGSVTAL